MRFEAELDGTAVPLEITEIAGTYQIRVGDRTWAVDARPTGPGIWSLLIGGWSTVAQVDETDGRYRVEVDGEPFETTVEEETRYVLRTQGRVGHGSGQVVRAPMPGRVVVVEVEVGQVVKPGDGLVVLEAMKMENEFKAATSGTVKDIRVQPGQAVNPGDVMVVIE
jgi:biotin carboxyl carrier protein